MIVGLTTRRRILWRLVHAAAVAAILFVSACGAAGPSRTPASLRVIATPDNARIDIDERFAGSARVLALRPKELRAGSHRVTVSAPGHFPHDLMLDLPPGETKIEISLRPIP